MRKDGRASNELREIHFTRNVNRYAEGSCLVEMGATKVLCTVTVEEKVPPFLKDRDEGWLTCEYRMLPRSTNTRMSREKLSGRIYEIQRLIGRSLRSIFDCRKIAGKTFIVDCDVLQADGGTRTASVNAGFVALVDAALRLHRDGKLKALPISQYLAAVSVGVIKDEVLLDLCYEEDCRAEVDMNVVMTGNMQFVELQGTAERKSFDRALLDSMVSVAEEGITKIIGKQKLQLKDALNI